MITSFRRQHLSRQRGMGATIILFTIALIVLVGAALAYGSRGNSRAFSAESSKVFSSVLLKQSAEYRDAYNRYIFDGGIASSMTFDTTSGTGLFNSTKQYGIEQDPPVKAFVTPSLWLYNKNAVVTGIGTTTADSIVYVTGLAKEVCEQVNTQMYGVTTVPIETVLANAAALAGASPAILSPTFTGRATGCIQLVDATYAFYSTLAEN
ncbi:hypothetical protein QN362_08230 [Actimicrobium sp. CCC2.4]|uniref:hypothetical protein n=1 Tax=Actimicrobium sp. CCC2.4 TaxID=3048606 RepID=UPI002AC8D10D|nr:hypothetical protein [Actimicrobium sp. CCC2.4]MEB0135318.1 hypothetical protein [Actimicrobium sp. CCC2.4]WPX31107.1 hypothetical protein RHM62_12690 [Actimicrobium sp. CCC2.4]